MLGLGTNFTKTRIKKTGFTPYGPAAIQLDAASPKSAEATIWRDLKGLSNFNAINATLSNAGTPDAYYSLSGTGYFRPDSNPDILADLHKTTAGNSWTLAIAGETTGVDNDWIFGSHPSNGVSNGFGLKWAGNTNLLFHQFTNGTGTVTTPTKLENNKTFLLIISFNADTSTYRIWETDRNKFELTTPWNPNTNDPDGLFTLGGLSNGGQFHGKLFGFMAIPEFIDTNGARSIIDYYNTMHPRTYVPETLNVLLTGQSNMEKMFTDYSGAGAAQMQTAASAYFDTVTIINGAKGAAAVHHAAAGSAGAFLNSTNDGKGDVYTDNLEVAITTAGLDNENIDAICVLIGETDSVAVNNGTITESEHKAAYLTYLSLLKTDFPNAQIIPVPLIADTNGNEFTGWGKTRRAQYEVLSENTFLSPSPAMYDLSFSDDLHLNQAGYEAMGTRLANRIAAIKGKRSEKGTLGPKAIAATHNIDAQNITITIEHDNGTDFTLSEERGHNPEVGDIAQTVNSASRTAATTYTLTVPANTLTNADTVETMFPWGTLRNYNRANILIDNAADPLPLRPFFDLISTEG